MDWKHLIAIVLVTSACSSTATTTTTAPVQTTSTAVTTTMAATSSSAEPVVQCPPAPYELGSLPNGVGETTLDIDTIEPDVWTSVGGTNTTYWGRSDGTVAIALIRGTLPAREWPGEKGEELVDGTRAAVGPHPDGTWVMGWFVEPQGRCDLYTVVWYPPVTPPEVEATIDGMVRVVG